RGAGGGKGGPPPSGVGGGGRVFLFLFCSMLRGRIAPMARSSAAVNRPPAPASSWPSPPAPAGGFARRPPPSRVENARSRPAAVDLDTPADGEVAVEGERRRGRGAQSNATGRYEPLARIAFERGRQRFRGLR